MIRFKRRYLKMSEEEQNKEEVKEKKVKTYGDPIVELHD